MCDQVSLWVCVRAEDWEENKETIIKLSLNASTRHLRFVMGNSAAWIYSLVHKRELIVDNGRITLDGHVDAWWDR